jgi:CheY-like chemotaxis protein
MFDPVRPDAAGDLCGNCCPPRGFLPEEKKTLLCIDDELIGLKIRKLILERSGYEVLTAEDGPKGLELFRSQDVHGVVLDYFMPGMDGGIVARHMKEMKPRIPILMLSAYFSLPDHALDHVDAFITKGQSPEILIEKIRELVPEPSNG